MEKLLLCFKTKWMRYISSVMLLLFVTGYVTVAQSGFVPPPDLQPPYVITDKPDYSPGETVKIAGLGFTPGETVQLSITHWLLHPGLIEPLAPVVAHDDGSIYSNEYSISINDFLEAFTVTARGLTSGTTVTYDFTDGSYFTLSVGSQNPSTVYQGGIATYIITITPKNGANYPFDVSGFNIPSLTNATYSFLPINLHFTSSQSQTTTLTITTNTSVTTQKFNVSSSLSPSGDQGETQNNVNLTVAACTAPAFSLCPANQTVNASPNLCYAPVNYTATATGTPTPTMIFTYTFSGATNVSGNGTGSGSTFNKGITTVTITAANTCGTANCSFTVTVVDNQDPTIATLNAISVNADQGVCTYASSQLTKPTATDNCSVVSVVATPASLVLGANDVTWTVTDGRGNTATSKQLITVINTAPIVTSFTVNTVVPVSLGTSVTMTVVFNDNENNAITVVIDYGNGYSKTIQGPTSGLTDSYTYPNTGVYSLTATVYDACGLAGSLKYEYVVMYDPNGGFVTGGGWIMSTAGAYSADVTLTGKANFGFVSKYKKGSNIPDGNTEFQFKAGNLNFKSSIYDQGSLVIAGARAIYKGVGTINGTGNYGFMVFAIDGDVSGGGGVDKFRIKIWDKNNFDAIVYDNGLGADENVDAATVLGGGSIVIHNPNKPKGAQIQAAEFGIKAYPNPFTDHVYFDLQLKTDSKVRLEIYTIEGSKLATIYDDVVVAFDQYRFEYNPERLSTGTLVYRLVIDGQLMYTGKLMHY